MCSQSKVSLNGRSIQPLWLIAFTPPTPPPSVSRPTPIATDTGACSSTARSPRSRWTSRRTPGCRADYRLKLNSYDLGVDIELADAIQRIRFEHPETRVVVVTSLKERIFCAGANIMMLRGASHGWKVNFCKFTNETRLAIEDASEHSGIKFLAALNGICAGGGYELALACDEIVLVDDGNSAVSLPEAPLLGVLPGTGGLTRVVDKRRVRRDLADFFSTLVEGVKGKRAVGWRLVDAVYPTSQFKDAACAGARRRAGAATRAAGSRRKASASSR